MESVKSIIDSMREEEIEKPKDDINSILNSMTPPESISETSPKAHLKTHPKITSTPPSLDTVNIEPEVDVIEKKGKSTVQAILDDMPEAVETNAFDELSFNVRPPMSEWEKILDLVQRGEYAGVALSQTKIRPTEEPASLASIIGSFTSDALKNFLAGLKGEQRKTFQDLLAEEESKGTLKFLPGTAGAIQRSVTGLTGSIAVDPATYIPGGALGKIPGVSEALSGLGKIAKKIPGISAFVNIDPKEFQKIQLLSKWELTFNYKNLLNQIKEFNKGLTKEDRELLALAKVRPELRKTLTDFQKEKLADIAGAFDDLGRSAVENGYLKKEIFEKMRDTYLPGIYGRTRFVQPYITLFNKGKKATFLKQKKFESFADAIDFTNQLQKIADAPTLEEANKVIKDIGVTDMFEGFTGDMKTLKSYTKSLIEGYTPEKDILSMYGKNAMEHIALVSRDKLMKTVLDNPELARKVPYTTKFVPEGKGLFLPKGALKFYAVDVVIDKDFYKTLTDIANNLKVETKQVITTTKKIGSSPEVIAPLIKMEKIAKEALMGKGFTEPESLQIVNRLKSKGESAIDEIVQEITEIRSLSNTSEAFIDVAFLSSKVRAMIGITGKVPVYVMDKNIVSQFNKVGESLAGLPKEFQWLINHYDKIQGTWKGLATAVRLPFHIRNYYSNQYLSWLAGVDPLQMPSLNAQALAVASNGRVSKGLGEGIKIKGILYTWKDLNILARRYGVSGGGWMGAESPANVEKELDDLLKGKMPSIIGTAQKFGAYVEDNARISVFIDQLKKGKGAIDASMHVKKFLFDYSELQPFEKEVMKRFVPFYTWMRKNIPLQIETMLDQPAKVSMYSKVQRALQIPGKETEEEHKNVPSYFDEIMYIKSDKKDKKGNPIYYSLDLPINDLPKLFALKANIWKSLTPFIGLSASLGDVRITPKVGEKFTRKLVPAPWYLAGIAESIPGSDKWLGLQFYTTSKGEKILGMDEKMKYYIQTALPFLNETEKMFPIQTHLEDKAPYAFLSYITGVKISPVDYKEVKFWNTIEFKKAIEKELKRKKQIGKGFTKEELDKMKTKYNIDEEKKGMSDDELFRVIEMEKPKELGGSTMTKTTKRGR